MNKTFFCYIIYSKSIDKYYIGETADINARIDLHNSGYFCRSFTAIAKDWALFLEIKCNSRAQARKIEAHIKKMKSRTYIQNLKKYPTIISSLLIKYPD